MFIDSSYTFITYTPYKVCVSGRFWRQGRFVLRNNSHIKDFSKWLSHMKDIYDERTGFDFIAKHNPVSFFVLKQNQYLSDIIDDLYWKKQHCDAYIV